MTYPTYCEDPSLKSIATNFALTFVNFILKDHGLPLLPPAISSEGPLPNPNFQFDPNIGKVVIALIKGPQKYDLLEYVPHLEKLKFYWQLDGYITKFVELFFHLYESDWMNICMALGYVVMHAIYKEVNGWQGASTIAFRGVTTVLAFAQDREFLQTDGLSRLSSYALYLIQTDEEILKAYEEGKYPW